MKMIKKKIAFRLIVATRNIFNPQLAKEGRKQLLKILDKLGFEYFILPEDATANGVITVCKVPHLKELLSYKCQNGFEHHVAMNRSHCADVLREVISRYTEWDLYYHGRIEN